MNFSSITLSTCARRVLVGWAAALFLAGCAGEQAYREGSELLAQGKVGEGLAKLGQAVREAPDNPRFRAGYLRERDRNARQLLASAESLRAVEQYAEAEVFYRRALELDPSSEQALIGLRELRAEQSQRAQLRDVRAKLDRREYDAARGGLLGSAPCVRCFAAGQSRSWLLPSGGQEGQQCGEQQHGACGVGRRPAGRPCIVARRGGSTSGG